jgi:ArsR family transcriptional regulator
VRLLLVLGEGEVCLCQLADFIGLALSTASRHMSILREAGLVRTRKAGRWLYFRQAGCDATPVVREALGWLRVSLAHDPQAGRDRQHFEDVLQCSPEDSCARPDTPARVVNGHPARR